MWGNSRFLLPRPLWRDAKAWTFPHGTLPNRHNLKGISSLQPDTHAALLTGGPGSSRVLSFTFLKMAGGGRKFWERTLA